MISGSGRYQRDTEYMILPCDLWREVITALESGDERARNSASLRLIAGAPRTWDPPVIEKAGE